MVEFKQFPTILIPVGFSSLKQRPPDSMEEIGGSGQLPIDVPAVPSVVAPPAKPRPKKGKSENSAVLDIITIYLVNYTLNEYMAT